MEGRKSFLAVEKHWYITQNTQFFILFLLSLTIVIFTSKRKIYPCLKMSGLGETLKGSDLILNPIPIKDLSSPLK